VSVSVTIASLKPADPTDSPVEIDVLDDNMLCLQQDDDMIVLDYRQRQQLAEALEKWPPQ
jgi:hypothetical protein